MGDLQVLLAQVDQLTRSVMGLMNTSPGPPTDRPSRNKTIRWYSRTILTERPTAATSAAATTPMRTSTTTIRVPPSPLRPG